MRRGKREKAPARVHLLPELDSQEEKGKRPERKGRGEDMRTVSYRLGDLARATINIGKVAENEYTRVQFNAEQIFAEYPAATAALNVINPAGTAYPAVVTREGDLIIWDVTDADLTAEGMGELQLTLTENGVVCKSYIARTRIERSIVASGSTPDPVQNWLDQAAEVLEEVT